MNTDKLCVFCLNAVPVLYDLCPGIYVVHLEILIFYMLFIAYVCMHFSIFPCFNIFNGALW